MSLLSLLVTVLILGLIFAVIWWAIQQIAMPPPFKMVAVAVFAILVVIVLLSLLTGTLTFPVLRLT